MAPPKDERTLAANEAAFAATTFRPRVLRGIEKVDITSTVLGQALAYPHRARADRLHPDRRPRRRARRRPGCSARRAPLHALDDEHPLDRGGPRRQRRPPLVPGLRVARPRAGEGDDRPAPEPLATRRSCSPSTPAVLGRRERDVRRGFSLPAFDRARHHPRRRPAPRVDVVVRAERADPLRQRRGTRRGRRGLTGHPVGLHQHPVRPGARVVRRRLAALGCGMARSCSRACSASTTRSTPRRAASTPSRSSNHGGRQLDGAPAPFSLVAPVVDAVDGRAEVICDGGVRRGSDIVKAVAAGATACMAGRAYLYGLGAAGERGVDRVLEWFSADLVRTMSLLGAGTIAEPRPLAPRPAGLTPSLLWRTGVRVVEVPGRRRER